VLKIRTNRILLAVLLGTSALTAQERPRGHWSGNINIPDQALAVEVDLDKPAKDWVGSISIPAQNATGIPLEAVAVTNGKVTFRIQGAPGEPTFIGALSADGKTLSGDFSQAGGSFPFQLSRTGEAKVEEIKRSPAVAKQFLGTWEGTLEVGQSLRLILKVTNDESGAHAVLVSVDQGGAQIPVATVEQKDATLTLSIKAVGGGYRGDINKEGTELTGAWTQAGNDLPLKFKKKGEPAKP
jgi:hypothetical protein